MRQLRLVYSTARRDIIDLFSEVGAEVQPYATSDTESSENMQVSTPTMSVSSESDLSEINDNKGKNTNNDNKGKNITLHLRCMRVSKSLTSILSFVLVEVNSSVSSAFKSYFYNIHIVMVQIRMMWSHVQIKKELELRNNRKWNSCQYSRVGSTVLLLCHV